MRKGGPAVARTEDNGRRSQTADLLRAYHERGDTQARQRLVELYLPLVESFMRRYARGTDDYDDLYQVGCIGLINAIDRFDASRGDEFAAFAVPNIAGEIRRYLRDRGGSVRLPRRVLELRSAAAQAQGQLRSKLGREPTAAEVATEVGANERDVALALDAASSQALELQESADSGESTLDTTDDRLFLSEAFRGLDDRERRIMYMRYIRDAEPDAIAAELGISRRQLARSTEEALKKLRIGLENPGSAPAAARDTTRSQPRKASPREPREPRMASKRPAEPERPIDQAYHIELVKSGAPGGGWDAQVEELPGCAAHGESAEAAAAAVESAIAKWIADAEAEGRDVPKPRSAASYSGRLLVRMPQSLHAELARAAERDEVSLNQFITGSLASAVRWRGGSGDGAGESAGETPEPRAGYIRTALVANVALLALIAALAVALLIIAVTRG
ncbi:MAG TPA: sigma-70 family RNA polymerase sigma factor [Thermoleophilaceae bacterium]|nr:sigma-70 family RNA polymerase sigma factor [Thermoleophilaceae bacterium]